MSFCNRWPWLLALILVTAGLSSCVSTLPSAEQLDDYTKVARAELAPQYAALDEQRAAGQISPEHYASERALLDQKVQNRADDKAWGRHMLSESQMKASGIPTPDQPIDLQAPGTGALPNSIYNTPRNNIMTGGQQGSYLGTGGRY